MVHVQYVSCSERRSQYRARSTRCYPWGLCVSLPHHTLADKKGCLEEHPPPAACPKTKRWQTESTKTYFTHFLWVITQIKLEKLRFSSFFFFHWNAGINGVKMEKRDCEKWLIVAISSAFDLASSQSDCWTDGKTWTESFGVQVYRDVRTMSTYGVLQAKQIL